MMKIARRSEGAHGAADAWRKRNGGARCGGRVAEAQQGYALRWARGRGVRGSMRTSLCLMARLFALRCEGAARLFI